MRKAIKDVSRFVAEGDLVTMKKARVCGAYNCAQVDKKNQWFCLAT